MDTRRASLLIPRGPGSFIPVDKETVETLAFNGVLLQHRMVTRSAGQTQRFEIQTRDTEAYTGTANLNGNTMPIQFKVPSHSLMGVRTASSALAQKIAQQSERRPITLSVYNAAINQRGPTNHVATLTSKLKDGGLMLEESYGPQSRKTTRTKKGHLLTATSSLGPPRRRKLFDEYFQGLPSAQEIGLTLKVDIALAKTNRYNDVHQEMRLLSRSLQTCTKIPLAIAFCLDGKKTRIVSIGIKKSFVVPSFLDLAIVQHQDMVCHSHR